MGHDILFHFPQAGILIILLLPFLLAQIALSRYRKKMLATYAVSPLLPHLLIERSPLLRYTKLGGWGVIWTLSCLALMEPFGNLRYASSPSMSHSYLTPHEVIFLVDTSASMRVPDGENGQTRLETAKSIIEEVLHQLHGQTVALYTFTSELTQVVPPTLDYLFTRLAIHDLHINQGDVGGTRLAPILTALKQQAFPTPSNKRYTLIMLTDGGDTQLEALPNEAHNREKQAILQALPNPEQFHLKLLTIGMGSLQAQAIPHVSFHGKPVSSKLEPDILQLLAKQEKGIYYMASEWNAWDLAQELMKQINANASAPALGIAKERQVQTAKQEEMLVDRYYQIPLGLALLFYCLNLLLPDVRRL